MSKFIPEFEDQLLQTVGEPVPTPSPMTIEQLMTQTAGLTYGWTDDHPVEIAYKEADLSNSRDSDDFIARLAAIPLRFEPGTRYHYSVSTDVLGVLVERISGRTLEEFFHDRIFSPLEMEDTFFNVPAEKMHRLATNHMWDYQNNAMVLAPDQLGRPPTGIMAFSGGGGLISTAMDYMIFCEMLRMGGSYNGVRILGPKTVQFMTMNQISDEVRNNGADEYPASHLYRGQSAAFGGGVITDPGQTGVISSKGACSWGGIANTKFWIDPEEDLVAILMTQLVAAPSSNATRFNMKVATYQALTELGHE